MNIAAGVSAVFLCTLFGAISAISLKEDKDEDQ